MINKKSAMITSFVVFLVGVAVLVLLGILFHEEPTFSADGMFWRQADFPIKICSKSHSGVDKDAESSRYAIESINDQLGFHALSFSSENEPGCLIGITTGVPQEPNWTEAGGNAKWRIYDWCNIRISNPPPGKESLIIQHEIGHCFGLDHDPSTNSLMYKEVLEDETKRFPPALSVDDVNAIRSRYFKGATK